MMIKIIKYLLCFCCVATFAAFAASNTPASIAQKPVELVSDDLEITEAYVQPLIPGQKNTSAYMRISNHSKQTYTLIGASSSIAQRTEIHTVLIEEGMMRMRPVGSILLLPNEEVLLQPGDLHIMLMDVAELNKDMEVPLCLEFKDSATVCLNVPVRDKRGEAADLHAH